MQHHDLPGTDLRLSTFCYGTGTLGAETTDEQTAALLNTFRDAGGNFLDTAHVYAVWTDAGSGSSERAIARYFSRHGGRDEMVVATKGGHPAMKGYDRPAGHLDPATVARDVEDSLRRLETDRLDLYWLHRDDPELEVGAIVDMMNDLVRRGRLRWFGASNWAADRIQAANAYAASHGLKGFVASQPQWNLAAIVRPPGTTRFLDATDLAWHTHSRLPVIPYSATARGYFATGRPDRQMDADLSDQRRRRAMELAGQLEATATQVALAWLLAQPFPVFPILGTLDGDHLREDLAAERLALTPEQRDWLRDG